MVLLTLDLIYIRIKLMKLLAIGIGVLLLILAVIYFITPANSLPTFLPGYDTAITKTHLKHGVGSLLLALVLFAYAWFQGGKSSTPQQ